MSVSYQEHHAPNIKAYLTVFGVLLVLTVITVAVSWLRLPMAVAVALALLIAAFKAGLVAAFFMHLKGERKLIYGLLALTIFFMIVLMFMPGWDVSYIDEQLVHGEAPLGAGHGGP